MTTLDISAPPQPNVGTLTCTGPTRNASRPVRWLPVMSPQPVDIVRYGALDVVLRPEAGVRPQPGDVEVVVRGSVRIATLREGDVRARNRGVDRVDDLAVPHQPSTRDVVDPVVQPLREHEQRDGPAAVLHVAEICGVLGVRGRSGRGEIGVLAPDRRAE